MSASLQIALIAITVACNGALIGSLLFLKRRSLVADTVAHSVLLGFVLGFFITQSLNSPWLLLSASLSGLLCLAASEYFSSLAFVKIDAAQVLLLSFFFALALAAINLFGEKVHLDSDAVMLGELAFAPFQRISFSFFGLYAVSLPKALFIGLSVLFLNILFIALLYKQLVSVLFDTVFAVQAGLSPRVFQYALVFLATLTAISAFDAVGTLLALSFFAVPPATAFFFARSLKSLLILATLFAVFSSMAGYGLAALGDFSIAGSIGSAMGLLFVFTLLSSRILKKL